MAFKFPGVVYYSPVPGKFEVGKCWLLEFQSGDTVDGTEMVDDKQLKKLAESGIVDLKRRRFFG